MASGARLRRLGFSVACLPAIEIKAQAVLPRRSRYDAVVATSAKAFLGDGPRDTSSPLYVVGARTGRAAKARGWRLASPPATDAAELTQTLNGALGQARASSTSPGAIGKGPSRRRLTTAFRARDRRSLCGRGARGLAPGGGAGLASCVAALHYSRRSAGLARALAKTSGGEARFLELVHVCLSHEVAEPLEAAGATRIAIAETADEAGLFHALRRGLGGFPSLGASRI